jgi:hypothetical protein
MSVLDGGTLLVGGETMIHSGSTLTLGTSTFTSSGITMAGGSLAASTAAGEEGGLLSANVGTVSGYGDISVPVHLGASGLVTGSGGVLTLSGGVTGSGTLSHVFLNGGQITIGNSPGVITLEDVFVADNTTFDFSIQGTDPSEYDRLILTGDVTLAGMLDVELMNSFNPQIGDTFDILDFNTASGSFSEMNLPELGGGLLWDTSQLLVDGTLYIPLAGDFNNDGTVDAADYTRWKDNLGLASSALNGNGSGAATVVQADYLLWKTNFGLSAATGSEGTAAVPEPTTLLLALLALVAAPLRVRCG